MRLIKLIFIFLGLIIFLSIGILLGREYFVKKPEKIIPIEEEQDLAIPQVKEKIETPSTETTFLTTSTNQLDIKKPILLFNFPIIFPDIKYPEAYGYDPQSKTVRIYNIEEKTYQEIYKDENLNYLLFSKNGLLFFTKSKNKFHLINRVNDKKYDLPYFTQKVYFKEDIPYVFVSNLSGNNYLAEFDGFEKKILDIFILNPEIDFLNSGIALGENLKSTNLSPLYLKFYNNDLKLLLSPKSYLSFITNKKNLIFVSYVDNNWKSNLIDINNNDTIKEFNFGTLKEKCTFEELLICGVPKDQLFTKIEDWYYLKETFDDNLIIYDPITNNLQTIKLAEGFDIINPKLTPLGIIFFNRNDSFLYLISKDNFSF